jgi:putative ABC transport system substrate-binding protein
MRVNSIRRRDFITLLGGAVSAWPLAARAQKSDGVRRIGVLMNLAADDPDGEARVSAFRQALQELGWTENRNVRIDYRWGAGDAALYRRYAAELVALAPDVILAGGGQAVGPLREASLTVPIVFTNTNDPITLRFVESLARPGGNATGFINVEPGFSIKWLELLKEIAPNITRAAVLRDSTVVSGLRQFEAIQSAAPSRDVKLSPVDVHDIEKLERGITAFAREANSGLIVTSSTQATIHRDLIIALAARHRLPAIYPTPLFVVAGGLISYGPLFLDQYRRAADYVNRILKGANPANLPVQTSAKYEMAVNLKTAKALGLMVPRIVLFRADQLID